MKKTITLFSLLLCLCFSGTTKAQSYPFLGQIAMFAGNYAPQGWALCNGQLLSISQNPALYSILGTTYGGDGINTFALPDLRGRAPIHAGQGPGLSQRNLGNSFGTETNTLNVSQMPAHRHSVFAVSEDGNQSVPTGNLPAGTKLLDKEYSNAPVNTTMSNNMIGDTGGNLPVNNMQPVIVINYIIAIQGTYPTQN